MPGMPIRPEAARGGFFSIVLALFLVLSGLAPGSARAGEGGLTSVLLMHGWDYRLGDESRTILTVEHAGAWRYGDQFFFIDATNADAGGTNAYGEWQPRLSFSKITGSDLSLGIFRDFLASGGMEFGNNIWNYLYGAAADLALPGFLYATVNFYVRDNPDLDGRTYQITPVWAYPFALGRFQFMFEGFADIAGAEGSTSANIMAQPRLLLDIGALWNAPGHIQAGVEYMYWHNKFGVEGVTESLPQATLKVTF